MKKMPVFLKNPYHTAFAGFVVLFMLSLSLLFTFRTKPLPHDLPPKILAVLTDSRFRNMPVFTTTSLFDHLINRYPDIDIHAGGYTNSDHIPTTQSVLLLSLGNIPNAFDTPNNRPTLLAQQAGVSLFLLSNRRGIAEVALSASVNRLRVSSFYYPEGAPFRMGAFVTGHRSWTKVYTLTETFGGKQHEAIWCHPLDDGKPITIVTPPLPRARSVRFASGITDVGKCSHCPPVTATLTQGTNRRTIAAKEGAWEEIPLSDFDATKPITITISTKKSGKRHYAFNLLYTVKAP